MHQVVFYKEIEKAKRNLNDFLKRGNKNGG